MSNSIIVETELKDILTKLDHRLDRMETKVDDRLERMETKLEVLPKLETQVGQLQEDVKDLKGRANAQIWALIITVIGATTAAIVKFGFLSNP